LLQVKSLYATLQPLQLLWQYAAASNYPPWLLRQPESGFARNTLYVRGLRR
jgi:hypothetical protein